MTARRRGKHPSAGFLLLEVLTALIIAALVLAMLVRTSAESSREVRVSLDTQEAVVRARSRLAALVHGELMPGQRAGDDGGGFTWRMTVVPLQTAIVPRDHGDQYPDELTPSQTLYAVTVEIAWQADGTHRHLVLETRRLGAPPPDMAQTNLSR